MQSLLVLLALSAVVSGYYAPVLLTDSPTVIPGQYILVYHANSTKELISAHAQSLTSDPNPRLFEISDFKGFSAKLSAKELDRLRKSPNVNYIEADQVVTIADTASCTTQKKATWGLDRIDKDSPAKLDDTFTYFSSAGEKTESYIIDTGILTTHTDFQGRAFFGVNTIDNQNTDCNGHGTHVAGTVGGATWGVAKKTTLFAVKVLNCAGSGTNSAVIDGINWVPKNKKNTNVVANLSLGGTLSLAVNSAVDAASKAGVVMVVAAGNSKADACKYSPASAETAISVGATYNDANGKSQVDVRADFSNWGTCVTIFAPGQNIDSAWIGSNTATRTISGTSMASPHVAGVAALYLGDNPQTKPADVKAKLVSLALTSQVTLNCAGLPTLCNNTPNKLLHFTCS